MLPFRSARPVEVVPSVVSMRADGPPSSSPPHAAISAPRLTLPIPARACRLLTRAFFNAAARPASAPGLCQPASAGLIVRPGGTISSIRSSSDASSSWSIAPICPSSCSIVRGPMIAEVTAGWLITNASARWIERHPGLVGELRQGIRGIELRLILRERQVVSVREHRGAPRPQLVAVLAPLAAQPTAGERAPRRSRPCRNRWQVGSTSASIPRASREYGGCSQT